MIRDLETLRRALKNGKTFAGLILYEGPSALDGAPIVAIATKILAKSANSKTGHMVQSYILRSDLHPMEALANGADASVCGSCKHRPRKLESGRTVRTCYVEVAKSVASVWGAYANRNRYARPGIDYDAKLLPALFEGLAFRIGSYGDPAAIPFQIWRAATLKAAMVNGYTHQWQDSRFAAFKLLCMASADSADEMAAAHAAGWRTFRVRALTEPVFKGLEVTCPASKEAGYKAACADCKACGGLSAKAKVSIVIAAHGATAGSFQAAA
jgi:hypothetical protein